MADPLEALLRPVASLLNRNIGEITPARELSDRLDGTIVAIRVRNTALAMYFIIEDQCIVLTASAATEPDVVITGSLLTLAGMLRAGGEEAIRSGAVELTGDARTAMLFQELLAHARPDIEEELSTLVGDVAAHRLGEMARGVRKWAQGARATMQANIREYLQEESRDVPTRYEVERFTRELGVLRDDVERLAARMSRLENGS